MRKTFAGLAILLLLAVAAEFYFAASGAVDPATYRPHHLLGYVIFLLPLLMAAVGGLARLPRRLIGLALLVTGLTSIQVLIAKLAAAAGDGVGALVFGLHAVGGLVLAAVAWTIVRRSLPLWRTATGQAGASRPEQSPDVKVRLLSFFLPAAE